MKSEILVFVCETHGILSDDGVFRIYNSIRGVGSRFEDKCKECILSDIPSIVKKKFKIDLSKGE